VGGSGSEERAVGQRSAVPAAHARPDFKDLLVACGHSTCCSSCFAGGSFHFRRHGHWRCFVIALLAIWGLSRIFRLSSEDLGVVLLASASMCAPCARLNYHLPYPFEPCCFCRRRCAASTISDRQTLIEEKKRKEDRLGAAAPWLDVAEEA